jgi:putative phosphoesterase
MRLAILSDVHGNYDALNAVLEECKKYKIEQYLCLGDYVGYYYEPKKVWDLIYSLNGVKIKGNHEDLLNGSLSSRVIRNQIKEKYGTGHQVAQNQLSSEEIKQLYNLPEKKLIQIGKYTFELNHGSPWDQNFYLYPDTAPEILEKANNLAIDFVLVGHSHYPFIKKLTHSTIINPGSVGQNRQKGGLASWVFVDLEEIKIEIISTKYCVKSLAKKVKINDPDKTYNYSILFRK